MQSADASLSHLVRCGIEKGSVLSHIGLQCGAVSHPYVSTPYWSHAVIQWLVDHIGTEWLWMKYTFSMHKDIRRRALKKMEREKSGAAAGAGAKQD